MSIIFDPKILIVGYGTVGKAVAHSLMTFYDLEIKDSPAIPIRSIGRQSTAAIVCVNADTLDDGSIDTSNVEAALVDIRNELGDVPIMVKTTLTPDLMSMLPDNAVYSPEFLRQSNATMDFQNQPFMLLGGDPKNNKFWRRVFKYLRTNFVETTPEAASWTKYIHNTYLASKVSWFHEIDESAEKVGDRQHFYEALGIINQHDSAIGSTHLYAPNMEGTYGYGGECFPKDMKAFQHYLNSDFLLKIMEYNDEQRHRKPQY